MHLIVVNFRLRVKAAKKGTLLKNSISSLLVIFLLALIISLRTVKKSVTTGPELGWMVLTFSEEMLGPYIFSDLMASSTVTGNFMINLDLINLLKYFWGMPDFDI